MVPGYNDSTWLRRARSANQIDRHYKVDNRPVLKLVDLDCDKALTQKNLDSRKTSYDKVKTIDKCADIF